MGLQARPSRAPRRGRGHAWVPPGEAPPGDPRVTITTPGPSPPVGRSLTCRAAGGAGPGPLLLPRWLSPPPNGSGATPRRPAATMDAAPGEGAGVGGGGGEGKKGGEGEGEGGEGAAAAPQRPAAGLPALSGAPAAARPLLPPLPPWCGSMQGALR